MLTFPPRDPAEAHRGATPLELLFDLASVVAIGAAAQGLAALVADGRTVDGLLGFLPGFFMVWWAWMNYTWFASSYDDGSTAFRALSMTIMFGALILAAGIDAVFLAEPIWLALLGFVVMRLGCVALWLGAARGDSARRVTARRYAGGIVAMQLYWVGLVALVPPDAWLYLPLFVLGACGELAVPAIAERAGATPWHRQHIVSRYGRLNLIVLGQAFLAVVTAIELAPGAVFPEGDGLWRALLFAVIAFSLWSLYFTDGGHLRHDSLRHALLWGYGHIVVFGAGAAVGAGMQAVLHIEDGAAGSRMVALAAALYCAMLWLIRDRYNTDGRARWSLLVAAALVAGLGAVASLGLAATALVLVAAALVRRRPG